MNPITIAIDDQLMGRLNAAAEQLDTTVDALLLEGAKRHLDDIMPEEIEQNIDEQ